jgi:pyruvate dehydrogenase (quinone)
MATSGPGGIHLLNGLYDARCDGQAVLAITGHTFHDLIGTHYQQDVDLDKLFMDVAVFNQRVMGPAHVDNLVDGAIKAALARRGVSHITIPKDIQEWTSDDEARSNANIKRHSGDNYAPSYPLPHENLLKEAADIINRGEKVVILAGRGCLNARDEVLELAEKVAGPIVKPLLGKSVVPDDSPYTTGGIGLLGTSPSQEAMASCDTLVMLGTSFPYIEFYPKPGEARSVQVDVDAARIGLRYPADAALVGDCREVLRRLLPLINRKEERSFLEKAQKGMKDWNELLKEQATRDSLPMKPQAVMYELNKLLQPDAIVSTDSGTITAWTARYIQMRERMQFSCSGTLASMANALPYSIGAAVGHPGRQVVCVIGDGGFTMLMGEVATLVKYGLPVKIIILRNNLLGMIKWEQIVMEGNPQYGVELQPIDFAAFARACGATGYTLERPDEARAVLSEALDVDGPVVVDALIDPNEPPMPGHISMEQALHFAEALARGQKDSWEIIKTVAENKIREVI